MNSRRLMSLGFLTLFFLGTLLSYWLRIGDHFLIPLRELFYVVAPGIALLAALFVLHAYGLRGMYGKAFLFLALGFGCWFCGEILWVVYEYLLHIDPYPSAADYFYLLGYPFLIAAFWSAIRQTGITKDRFTNVMIFLFVLNSIWMTVIVLYFGIYAAYNPAVSLFENVIAMSYGLGDLAIFLSCLFSLVLAWEYREGKIVGTWLFLFAGFFITLVADMYFARVHLEYEAGNVIYENVLDTWWILGYLYFAFALFDFGLVIRGVQAKLTQHLKT